MNHHVRVLDPDELRAAHTLFAGALHQDRLDDESWERSRPSHSRGRAFGVSEGAALIGTATSFPTRTAVPGGAALGTAAVTRVGVRADRTRRGVLSAMMRTQLDDAAERGEPLASLRASEARIYGRFGYGVASRGREVAVGARGAGWRAPATGSVRMLTAEEVVPVLSALHDTIALHRPGGITRPLEWWTAGGVGRRLARHQHLVAAVHTGADGAGDGFVVVTPADRDDDFAARTMRVSDLHATSLDATAGLWRFVLDLDLVARAEGWLRPVDEPLELLLTDPRDCAVRGVEDETWLRIVDVPVALATRSWGDAAPVLLGVHDRLRPQNTGVYRLGDGPAERVGSAAPELECDVAALGMAYLGDRAPSLLAATGWWQVHEPAALARADTLFATAVAPWCGTYF